MSFSQEGYLQILDNWIQDEDKVITYRHLSLALGVPCHQAKSMLQTYVENLRSDQSSPKVHLVYLLTGYISEEAMVVKLIPEMLLESAKSRLSTVTSVHPYSISKSDIRNPFLLRKASTLIKEDVSNLLQYSQIANPTIERRTLRYKSASHVNETKIEKFVPTTSKHPNDFKNPSLSGRSRSSEGNAAKSKPSSSVTSRPSKNAQNKLKFSNPAKTRENRNVNKLDKDMKKIQIDNQSDDDESSSSHSDLDSKPRRYFPASLPQEVVESHVEKPKVTGFLEDDSDEEFFRTHPIKIPTEGTTQPSQISQELITPDSIPMATAKIHGKKRKRIQKPVNEHYVDAEGALVTTMKYVMVSTTDDSEPEDVLENALKKVKPNCNASKQSSLSSFFKK